MLGLLLIIGLTFMGVNMLNAGSGDTPPAALAVIAPYDDGIVLDGSIADWTNPTLSMIDAYEFGNPSSFVNVNFKFAYNNSYLFFYAYIPDQVGHVKAMQVHFFGQEGQNDGVLMDAYSGPAYYDMAFPEPDDMVTTPQVDGDIFGTHDVFASLNYQGDNGTYFEFAKYIQSGDETGKDIDLEYGEAIAVEFTVWVNVYPSSDPANYGTITEVDFRYIRLSIGHDSGDELDFGTNDDDRGFLWVEGETYQAPFLTGTIVYDGIADEPAWADATQYDITLSFQNYSDGTFDPMNTVDAQIKLFHDGVNFYIHFKVYDDYATSEDFLGFVLGKSLDMLNDTYGTDFIMINEYGYTDAFLYEGEPTNDVDEGGTNDGQANYTYVSGYHHVEFSKPLASGDTLGRDSDYSVGDTIFITSLASDDSMYGPNYFELKDIDGKPHFIVHAIKLLIQGEEPTTNPGGSNTFTLGFGLSDALFITLAVAPIVAVIYRKKFKK